jgi:hypothetical protein
MESFLVKMDKPSDGFLLNSDEASSYHTHKKSPLKELG